MHRYWKQITNYAAQVLPNYPEMHTLNVYSCIVLSVVCGFGIGATTRVWFSFSWARALAQKDTRRVTAATSSPALDSIWHIINNVYCMKMSLSDVVY